MSNREICCRENNEGANLTIRIFWEGEAHQHPRMEGVVNTFQLPALARSENDSPSDLHVFHVELLSISTRAESYPRCLDHYSAFHSFTHLDPQMQLHAAAFFLVALAHFAKSHGTGDHEQTPLTEHDPLLQSGAPTWMEKYGPQIDQPFSGPLSFSHLPYARCLQDESQNFDIAVLGMPFDTAVTYRPGARFGPYAIRSGSRRQRNVRGYTMAWGLNPYTLGYTIIDCGDVRTLVISLYIQCAYF